MIRKVWMKVTKDKYQLPVAVADSPGELAEMCGIKKATMQSWMSHARTKEQWRRCPYIRVEWEEADGEEE